MKRKLVFRFKARLDIAEAYDWYATSGTGLGDEFVQTVDQTLTAIRDNPYLYQKVRGQTRRAVLQRFPYGLFYLVSNDEIVITRCLHHRRNPTRWTE
jgi:plasmid stabilization system protein ParE